MTAKKAKKRTKPRVENNQLLFEFYRVFDNSLTDTGSDAKQLARCSPNQCRATIKSLSKVCAGTYGVGSFVGLLLGESGDGLPLSYWVIKVLSDKRHEAWEVILDDQELRNQRKVHIPAPSGDGESFKFDQGHPFWSAYGELRDMLPDIFGNPFTSQRGVEAGLASLHLDRVPDPQDKKPKIQVRASRKRGPDRHAVVDFAELLLGQRIRDKDILQQLIEKFEPTVWKGKDDYELEISALRAIASAKKRKHRTK